MALDLYIFYHYYYCNYFACYKFIVLPIVIIEFLSLLSIDDHAALLKRQGVNVKGLLKAAPAKEEPQPYIDCTGNLQVLH